MASVAQPHRTTRMEMVFNVGIFLLFAALWIGFFAALVLGPGSIDTAWNWVTGQPWFVQLVVWFLFLPVTAGTWIWETDWALLVRLVLVIGLGGFNLYLFFPRDLFRERR